MANATGSDFETNTPEGYVTFEVAAVTHTEAYEYWVLYAGVEVDVTFRDEDGNITEAGVITDKAAITDIDVWDESGSYILYGNEEGVRFNVEASVDPWTPVRLVDSRVEV